MLTEKTSFKKSLLKFTKVLDAKKKYLSKWSQDLFKRSMREIRWMLNCNKRSKFWSKLSVKKLIILKFSQEQVTNSLLKSENWVISCMRKKESLLSLNENLKTNFTLKSKLCTNSLMINLTTKQISLTKLLI